MAVAASTAVASPLLIAAVINRPILVVIYAVTFAISVWLFRDARRRGRSAVVAAGWAIGGFVLPGIVHFGYLYGRMGEQRPAVSPEDDG